MIKNRSSYHQLHQERRKNAAIAAYVAVQMLGGVGLVTRRLGLKSRYSVLRWIDKNGIPHLRIPDVTEWLNTAYPTLRFTYGQFLGAETLSQPLLDKWIKPTEKEAC